MRTLTLLLLCFFLAFSSAQARTPWPEAGEAIRGQMDEYGWPVVPDLSKVGRGERVPKVEIHTVLPRPGEEMLDTIVRAGQIAESYTRHYGFEACALVCENSQGQAGLRLTTNFSHVACQLRDEQTSCPAGFSSTSKTLHTHPFAFDVRANPVDAVYTGQRRGRRLEIHPHGFSQKDFHSGPGYLVAMGRLFYQEGLGTEREIRRPHNGWAARPSY